MDLFRKTMIDLDGDTNSNTHVPTAKEPSPRRTSQSGDVVFIWIAYVICIGPVWTMGHVVFYKANDTESY